MPTQRFSFQHQHGADLLTTSFGDSAQNLLLVAFKTEVPFVIVPHTPNTGKEMGQRVLFKVVFDEMTVTKCDKAGVPIPAKWKGAPEGATYTHKLIIEHIPEHAESALAHPTPSYAEKLLALVNTLAERTKGVSYAIAAVSKGDREMASEAVKSLLELESSYNNEFIRRLGKLVFDNTGVDTLGYLPRFEE
jgi:hypothetical protein